MPAVVAERSEYDYSILKPQIFGMLERFAGDSIKKGGRVVIKPNLLAPAPPDRAVLTHPLIVKAAVEYVLGKGAKPRISDSHAMGTFEKVLHTGGFLKVLEGLDVELSEFKESVLADIGEPFGMIEIARDPLDADVVINLPKLKTHSQMLLTLAVKNLFGCVVGLRKPEWHFRTGIDRYMFASLLVGICNKINPTVTILDGILAMEGQGPGKGGNPRHLGILLGSDSAFAVDMTVCRMLGMDPLRLLTNRVAVEKGFFDNIDVIGDLPLIEDFRLPDMTPLVFGPARFQGFIRRHLLQRPDADLNRCKACGECWKYCPAKAISHDNKGISFDYDNCIRCYCCIEVCPHAALRTRETVAGKIFRKFLIS